MRTVGHEPELATITVINSLISYEVVGKESDILVRKVNLAV